MMDLQRRYATTLDSTIVNQATTGLLAVATDVAYTDATPTGPELYLKILGAAAGSEATPAGPGQPRRGGRTRAGGTGEQGDDPRPGR